MDIVNVSGQMSTVYLTIICVVCAAVSRVLYVVLLSPLRNYPGPFLAKFTNLWIVAQCRQGRRSETVLEHHRKDQEVHQRKKKILSPAFSARNLQAFEPYLNNSIGKLMDCVRRRLELRDSTVLDFNEYSNFLAFDAIADFAFGEPFGFLDQEKDYLNLIEAVDARGEALNALGHLDRTARPFMKRLSLDPFWSRGLRGTKSLATLGTEAFFKRRNQDPEKMRQDLLSYLFRAKDPQTQGPLAEKEIIAESISFIVGGSDTTSTTMTNVVDIVSRSVDIQKCLHEELDTIFPGQMPLDWVADFKDVENLPVLNAVLRETMRIRPTSSTGLERVTPKGGVVIASRFIPEGTLVSVPTLNIHHNSSLFKNPEEFCYERWLASDSSNLLDSFIPFSVGPRACIGRNFAWMEMLKTLATLFMLFDLTRLESTQTAVREGFFVKNTECKIRLRHRLLSNQA